MGYPTVWVIFIAKRQVAIWNHTHFSIKFFWLASTGHISASTEAILKSLMCFQNYSKRSFQWNWFHFSIFIQIEMTEETRWHVKRAKCQISSKRPFSVKNHKEAIKKNFPNGFFSLMAQSTQEGVYFWDPMTKFFEIFFKVVPGSKMACLYNWKKVFEELEGFRARRDPYGNIRGGENSNACLTKKHPAPIWPPGHFVHHSDFLTGSN